VLVQSKLLIVDPRGVELREGFLQLPEVLGPRRRDDVDAAGELLCPVDDAGEGADRDLGHAVALESPKSSS